MNLEELIQVSLKACLNSLLSEIIDIIESNLHRMKEVIEVIGVIGVIEEEDFRTEIEVKEGKLISKSLLKQLLKKKYQRKIILKTF